MASNPACFALDRQADQCGLPGMAPGVVEKVRHDATDHLRVGDHGGILAMDGFGESAPAKDLAAHFGFTVATVTARVEQLIRDAS